MIEETRVRVKSNVFKPVTAADRVDYPALEHAIQERWDKASSE